MSNLEKINVFVPEDINMLLERDAGSFEIFKKDGKTINRNKFLNMLIYGYYDSYTKEYDRQYDTIVQCLIDNGMDKQTAVYSADEILKKTIYKTPSKKRGIVSSKISLKPVENTEPIILQVIQNTHEDSISKFFTRMITSYAQLPTYRREQIVFFSSYSRLLEACQKSRMISFTTIWNNKHVHTVLPYSIAQSKEEMYNYLLCQEYNTYTNKAEACTYRLNRITNLVVLNNVHEFNEDVVQHLEMMRKTAPQYRINNNLPIIVKMDSSAVKEYSRMYYGRPAYTAIKQEANDFIYTFNCSEDQAYYYFKRFDNSGCEVVQPLSLRERLVSHYKNCLKTYH